MKDILKATKYFENNTLFAIDNMWLSFEDLKTHGPATRIMMKELSLKYWIVYKFYDYYLVLSLTYYYTIFARFKLIKLLNSYRLVIYNS